MWKSQWAGCSIYVARCYHPRVASRSGLTDQGQYQGLLLCLSQSPASHSLLVTTHLSATLYECAKRKCSPIFKGAKNLGHRMFQFSVSQTSPCLSIIGEHRLPGPPRVSESVDVGQPPHHLAIHSHIFFFSSSFFFFSKLSFTSFWPYNYLRLFFPILYIVFTTF